MPTHTTSASVSTTPSSLALAALALAAISAGGFALPPVKRAETCLVGEAHARRAAYVPYALAARDHDARAIGVGFGSAAIGDWGSLGDALAVGGKLWLRTTRRDSPRYYGAIHNRYFRTHYFLYAPLGAHPSAEIAVHGGDLAALARAREARSGALFAGYVRFAQLETVAIAQPPVRAYAVAAHVPRYYTEPMERYTDVWAYVVGVIAPTPALQARLALDKGEISAHALILRGAPDLRATPRSEDVQAIGRVVAANAAITRGAFAIYPLHNLGVCAETTATSNSPA